MTTEKRFLLVCVGGVVVFFGLTLLGGSKDTLVAIRSAEIAYLPLVLVLVLANYGIRLLRWHYYLNRLHVNLTPWQSTTVFFAGLSMSVTPGKIGEAIKGYFVKKLSGAPLTTTFAIVFAERLTDLLAIVVLASIGSLGLNYGLPVVVTGALLVFFLLAVIAHRPLALACIRLLARLPRAKAFSEHLLGAYEHAYQLLTPRPLLLASFMAICAWCCEALAFYLVLASIGLPLALTLAIFIYAFATLFGALTLLPGGLAATEGSMAGLLIFWGLPKDAAAASTIVIRVATLWFAVALGILFLIPYRAFRKQQ